MGTITGQYIADGAWLKLQEPTGSGATRWTPTEALRAINNGQRFIVTVLPKAFTKSVSATPAGGTRQTMAGLNIADGITFIDVPANMASDGTTRGRAITKRERAYLDEMDPMWHSRTATAAQHWCQDPNDPKAIWLSPAVTGGGKVEFIYSATPTDLASLANVISIDDIYQNALEFFLLFSFHSKDADFNPGSATKAASYLQLLTQILGITNTNVVQQAAQAAARATGSTGAAG